MFEPNTVYAKIAYDAILLYLKTEKKLFKEESEIPPALKLKLACYVSLYSGNQLKGRVGNTSPTHQHLYNEIIENAVAAAFDEQRSDTLKEEELNNISIVVDVLSEPKKVEDVGQLKPQKHGVIVEDDEGRRGLLLPNVNGSRSTETILEEARKQGGIKPETPLDQLHIYSFTTTSYQ